MCISRSALFVLLTLLPLSASAEWLEFGAGCPDGTPPVIRFNGTWDDHLTFDVELTGLSVDTVTAFHEDYLRFGESPGTVSMDSIGRPELPVVRRMVWLPDDSDISLEWSAACCEAIECLPVYPAPLDSLVADSTSTPCIAEFFTMDSAAYATSEWYPDTLARLVGEFRLRDLRVGVVDVYPVQYLASGDSLRVWSDIEVSLGWDEGNAVWSEAGLGHFDNLIGDNLLGYTPQPLPLNDGDGSVVRLDWDELVDGPGYAPDYVILTGAGLDGQAVTDLADHRDDLNGFAVAIVRTDDVLECYGGQETVLTADMIRDFTDDMWDWGSVQGERPAYLLLIGDHEDASYAAQGWFLPTRTTDPDDYGNRMGSDGWYVGFGESRADFSVFPDMAVGRLPARTSAQLDDMVDLIIDYESAVTQWPPPSSLGWRRYLSRLSGTNECNPGQYLTYDQWMPSLPRTRKLSDWLGYSLDNYYCGDGEQANTADGSDLTSAEWCQHCRDVFSRGSQVVFYSNHGAMHMFSGGLNWERGGPPNFGIPDSSFDCFDVAGLPYNLGHGWPFILMLCCSAGTFNETQAEHDYISPPPFAEHACFDFAASPAPGYDFGTTSLAEAFLLNTEGGGIGVFAGSLSLLVSSYQYFGQGFLDAIYKQGNTRTGDAMQSCRLAMLPYFGSPGSWKLELGQFNLLGDPAVDLGDRVKFRDCCDIILSPSDLEMNRSPTMDISGHGEVLLYVTVRNAGAQSAGAFDVDLEITDGIHLPDVITRRCTGLAAGEERTLEFEWTTHSWFTPPGTLTLTATADDPGGLHPDSWTGNNSATSDEWVQDFYPNKEGWPCRTTWSVSAPPVLCDLDGAPGRDLEIVVTSRFGLQVFRHDSPNPIWESVVILTTGNDGSTSIPVTGDILGESGNEIVIDGRNALMVFDLSFSEPLCSFEHSGEWHWQSDHTVALADLVPESDHGTRDEMVLVRGPDLMVFDVVQGELVAVMNEELPGIPSQPQSFSSWPMVADVNGTGHPEIIVQVAWGEFMQPMKTALLVYDWDAEEFIGDRIWSRTWWQTVPCIGSLPSQGMSIVVSSGKNTSSIQPALILDATDEDLDTLATCESNENLPSDCVPYCVMADWDPILTGADRILANAENQCFGWLENGLHDEHYPIRYTGFEGIARPPFPALGDLDGDGAMDFLVATQEGTILAYDDGGELLSASGFPYSLPFFIKGGFAVADIDNDGYVEVVFGTMDNYLHVWQLGECDEGYAPWPQCQHDAARTGVLLEGQE